MGKDEILQKEDNKQDRGKSKFRDVSRKNDFRDESSQDGETFEKEVRDKQMFEIQRCLR